MSDTLHLLQDARMEAGQRLELAGFEAVAYSQRSPAKDTVNEDAVAVLQREDGSVVLAVADGMGGAAAGEKASALALQSLIDSVRRAGAEGRSLREAVLDGFEAANHAVLALGLGAGTTLAACVLEEGQVRGYHVGDSAILLVGQRGVQKLSTIPHSPTGYAIEAGLLDPEAALVHEDRHLVSNMVGDRAMSIDLSAPRTLALRDTLLVASDGLFDNLTLPEITELVRRGPLQRAADRLVERCLALMNSTEDPGKPDDLSLLLLRRRPDSKAR